MTLRSKLALGTAAALLVVWVVVSAVLYLAVGHSSEQRLDQQLMQQQQGITRSMLKGQGDGLGRRGLRNSFRARLGANVEQRVLPLRVARRELLAQIVAADGSIQMQSDPLAQIGQLAVPDLTTLHEARTYDEHVNGVSLRVRTVPQPGGGAVQLALPRSDIDALLARLRTMLFVAAAVAALAAAGVGYAVGRGALRPIARLTHTAERIASTGNLTARVPKAQGSDELAALSVTFNAMIDRLEQAHHAQRRFVADASHELRTPLTSLRGNAEYIQRLDVPSSNRIEAAGELIHDVERLDQIAGDLLALARLDAEQRLKIEPLHLPHLLQQIYQRHTHAASGSDHHLRLAEPVPDASIAADHALIERAISNLIVNALRYTPAGTTIDLRAALDPAFVHLEVRDDGPGMAPADAACAFDRFHRGATSHGIDGTGLGLAIVQAAAHKHGGEALLRTTLGSGCTFTITIPRAADSHTYERSAPVAA